jgi:putative transposase
VWTYDFLFGRTERGQTRKILKMLDEYTRECHAIRVERRLDSGAVVNTLAGLIRRQGAPAYLRSDDGGEFIAARLATWLARQGTITLPIEPGHPWENGYAESFNGKFRDECLNEEVFGPDSLPARDDEGQIVGLVVVAASLHEVQATTQAMLALLVAGASA